MKRTLPSHPVQAVQEELGNTIIVATATQHVILTAHEYQIILNALAFQSGQHPSIDVRWAASCVERQLRL